MKYVVCREDELGPNQKRVFHSKQNGPIVVTCNAKCEYNSIKGVCPHQGAALGEGKLTWTTVVGTENEYAIEREGEVLRCPWHGFDYDVKTGRCLASPDRFIVKTYLTYVEGGNIVVEV